MFNQDSPIIQNMINNGQFGTQTPLQQSAYNPYGNMTAQPYNNMIPIGQVGYNQPQQNNYVFAPVPQQQYGSSYQHPYLNNNYGANNNQCDYYDPYGMKGYNNPYSQNQGYYGNSYYSGYYGSYQAIEAQKKQQQNMMKLKHQIAAGCFGIKYTDEELERLVNPEAMYIQMPEQEKHVLMEARQMQYLYTLSCQPQMQTNAMRHAAYLQQYAKNLHDEIDNHSMREFLDDDLWKLNREMWIAENVNFSRRNLSLTYSSDDYNELLNMHASSNPYINELLDTSRYDNNLDDMEIGLPQIMDMQNRRRQVLEGKVPSFVSSDEAQKRRYEFTNQILNQIYNKGGANNV